MFELIATRDENLSINVKRNDSDNSTLTGNSEIYSLGQTYNITIKLDNNYVTSIEGIPDNFVPFARNIIEAYIRESVVHEQDGVEYSNEDDDELPNPYDPELIRVDTKPFSVSYTFELLSDSNEIDLSPDFQRNFVWDKVRKSRLIESLLLRIPLPVFYFSQDKEGRFKVVDGVQRLTVIKDFMSNKFPLNNLEYTKDCEGKYYDKKNKALDAKYKRRIDQTQLTVNVIDPQTPEKVKFDIFKRINTGGLPLNRQEIRNCMYSSNVRKLVTSLKTLESFESATGGVNPTRMADQDLILRFIGFYLISNYKELFFNNRIGKERLLYLGKMESFLDDVVVLLNEQVDQFFNSIVNGFENAMNNARHLFGEYAFRKIQNNYERSRRPLINKSLFITFSVLLAKFDYRKIEKEFEYKTLLPFLVHEIENNKDYYYSISSGTSDSVRINKSFEVAGEIIRKAGIDCV